MRSRSLGRTRRGVGLAVTLMLVVASMAPFAPAPPARTKSFPTAPFPDAATHWAAAEISRARAAGYVQGYPDGSFRPDRPVTNAELVRMLVAALGVAPVPGGPARYEDVRGHWVQEEGWLDAAEASGLLDPEEDAGQGRFFPDASAERRWAIVLAVRAAGGGDDARRAAVEAAPLQGFVDREAFHGMEGYVSVATAWGLVHGYPDGRWEPNRALTRAEAVVLAERVLAAVGGPIGQWPTYTNARYGVALQHPPGWKPDPRYPGGERWRGTTGFFQVGATSGCGLSVAEVAQREAEHKLAPYGHLYRIEATTAGGREGRLVLPGPDQPPEMEGQAALFVPYPRPWRIGEETYCHLILWADAGHMRLLAQTLRFAPETASSEPPLDASALRGQGRLALVREGRLYLLVGETGEVRLLDGSGRAAGPAFSPDGEWIAFVRRVPGLAGGTLMLVRAEGGEPSEVQGLPAPVAPGEYAWAPVGSTLAIAPAAATEGEGLWRAAPGEPARRLAAEGERVHGFAWSPDGRTLAYVVTLPADDPLARSDELRLLDVERGESVVRYTAERAGILLTGWWPDGRGLLFWLDPYHSASLAADGLPLLSLGEGEAKARELVTMLPRRDWVAWAPVASGDGATGRNRFVVVEGTSRFLWENKRLALCDAERATCRPLPQPEGTVALDPAWSPDGRRIAFVQAEEMRGRSGGVEDVAHWVEGRALQVMHADGQTAEPVSAAGQGVRQPRWSADDRHLLFVRADGIWLLLAGDGPPRRLASLPEPGQAAIDPLLMGRPDFAWWEGGH